MQINHTQLTLEGDHRYFYMDIIMYKGIEPLNRTLEVGDYSHFENRQKCRYEVEGVEGGIEYK